MKKILSLALLLGAVHLASAGSTNIYVENWGTGNSGTTGVGVSIVGWTGVATTFTAGPYLGIYANSDSPVDSVTGAPLPVNTVYFTTLTGNQTLPGMIYTTSASGTGAGGNSSFASLDPTQLTNLTFNLEVAGTANATNFFAIEEGGTWYVSVTPMVGTGSGNDGTFTNNSLPYSNLASAWNLLTVGTTNVTIGSTPGVNLSGMIQGVGVVELPTSGGWDYNLFTVSVFAPNPPPPIPATISGAPISQTVYAGGGAQFQVGSSGSKPITYIWQTNSFTLTNGNKYSNATTNFLTISNCNAGDAAVAYSVSVTNSAGGQTNTTAFTLAVNPVPAGWLYAETYPFVGPGANGTLGGVGWVGASSAGTSVGTFQTGTGLGAVFDYSPNIGTNLNYTTDTNDTGFSGLPFVDINPGSSPNVTFQAEFSPGNGAGQVAGAVTAYWAVQMTGGLWYASTTPIPISIVSQSTYLLDQLAFSTAASNWNTMTVNGGAVGIGGQATGAALLGNITGAGIIMIHNIGGTNNGAGASMNWQNFAITANAVTQVAPTINDKVGMYSQGVATGGGASFAIATSGGLQPFTYSWTLNGVTLTNGGRISGANSPTLTIANTTTNDTDVSGGNTGNVVAYVSNSIGVDNTAKYFPISLFVTNAPVGQLYTEAFPYVGPSGLTPVTGEGWTGAVPGTPNSVYLIGLDSLDDGLGANAAALGTAGTIVYYATSATDTNQAGLRFPSINLAFYPSLNFSVDIAPSNSAANVTTYLALQFNSNNWYVAASQLPVPASDSSAFATYSSAFNPAAAGWKNLTVTSSGGIIGSAAASQLTGSITGAGLVFVNTGSGGTLDFKNFTITGTGLGGINVSPETNGVVILSWVGNPAVNLESTTSLNPSSWSDVANTLGASSASVSLTGPQKFFRLVQH